MYGTWFTFALGAFRNATNSVPVYYSSISGGPGGVITSSNSRGIWAGVVNATATGEGLFPATDRYGLCGGHNICGTPACVFLQSTPYGCHMDQTYDKELYRK